MVAGGAEADRREWRVDMAEVWTFLVKRGKCRDWLVNVAMNEWKF